MLGFNYVLIMSLEIFSKLNDLVVPIAEALS